MSSLTISDYVADKVALIKWRCSNPPFSAITSKCFVIITSSDCDTSCDTFLPDSSLISDFTRSTWGLTLEELLQGENAQGTSLYSHPSL